MTHIRIDKALDKRCGLTIEIKDAYANIKGRMACGLMLKDFPEGDAYFFVADSAAFRHADCPVCNPGGPEKLGTPASQLSGRPGHAGFEDFCRIARSWGYD